MEEAERLVKGNNDAELMSGGLASRGLLATIPNVFLDQEQEISYYNFEAVVDEFLSGVQKLEMMKGN